jgi:hypothetical protein
LIIGEAAVYAGPHISNNGGTIMQCNVGGIDRIFRIVFGVVIILAGIYFQSWWGIVGLFPLLSGFFRFCPAYLPFRFSTCKTEKKQ